MELKAEQDGTFLIEVISTTPNLNKWGVTQEAIIRRFRELKGVDVLAINGHKDGKNIGQFTDAWLANNGTKVIGEFTPKSPEIAKEIKKMGLTKVSPSVFSLDAFEEGGIEWLKDFGWNHVAFVHDPAYPDIEVIAHNAERDNKSPPKIKSGGSSIMELEEVQDKLVASEKKLAVAEAEIAKHHAQETDLKKISAENVKKIAKFEEEKADLNKSVKDLKAKVDSYKADELKKLRKDIISADKDIETRLGKKLEEADEAELLLIQKTLPAARKPETSEAGREGDGKTVKDGGLTIGYKNPKDAEWRTE